LTPDLTASFVTLSGAGFVDPARNDFGSRAHAAAAAGFAGIGVQVADLAANGGLAPVRAVPADAGIAVPEAEFLSGWVLADDGTLPSEAERTVVELARAWGVSRVTTGEFAAGPADIARAADNLAAVAARLAEVDVRVAVEAFAWGAISDYPTALEIVRRSGAANVGIMIDIWHWFGTGADVTLLRDIDASEIVAVQLNDGPRVRPDDPDILHKARSTRWLPGDGELPLRDLLDAITETGWSGPYSVEVNYPTFRELPAAEAARLAYEKSAAVLSDR
jgi:sugar phosphate isomerase/epimerase